MRSVFSFSQGEALVYRNFETRSLKHNHPSIRRSDDARMSMCFKDDKPCHRTHRVDPFCYTPFAGGGRCKPPGTCVKP